MIGERFNFEDVFFRDLTICVLDTLEGEIKWTNRFSSGDRIVNVPFYYSMTGDERFLLDSFHDDIVSNSRYVDLNTDIVPRGHLTLTGYDIRSDEFANPNVWLKMVVENDEEMRNILTKVRAIPITAKYDLTIHLSSEVDTFKCSQAIMDTLWLYRFMYFEHNFMNIDAVMTIPDTNSIEINREKNLTSDNTIKLTVQFDVQTYYPSFRKPKLPKPIDVSFNCGVPNKNAYFRINVRNSNENLLLSEVHNCTSSSDATLNIIIGRGIGVKGNYSSVISDSYVKYCVEIDLNGDNNFVNLPFPTKKTVSTSYNNKNANFQISIYTNDCTTLVYSEVQNLTTNANGGLEFFIGVGESSMGNYFQLTSDVTGLKYDLEIDINGTNNFVPIFSCENLELQFCTDIFIQQDQPTRNDLLSNAYTQVGAGLENSDIILYPKMTRWYKNLISLTDRRMQQSDRDTNADRPVL